MKYHEVEMAGKYWMQIVSASDIASWTAEDEGRLVYNRDDGSIYYADDNSWVSLQETATTVHREDFVSTSGQTVFNLSTGYDLSTNELTVYADGNLMIKDVDYTETDADTVTFLVGRALNEPVSIIITDSATSTFRSEFIATASQQVFNLTWDYIPGSGNLLVFANNQLMVKDVDYTETDSSTITFTVGRTLSEPVSFIYYDNVINDLIKLAENLGTGADGEGIFYQKVGNTLQFKRVKSGTGINVTDEANNILIDADVDTIGTTTLYLADTGSDITGDGSVGNPWYNLSKAFDYLQHKIIDNRATVTIFVAAGTYTWSNTTAQHPQSSQITVSCAGGALLTNAQILVPENQHFRMNGGSFTGTAKITITNAQAYIGNMTFSGLGTQKVLDISEGSSVKINGTLNILGSTADIVTHGWAAINIVDSELISTGTIAFSTCVSGINLINSRWHGNDLTASSGISEGITATSSEILLDGTITAPSVNLGETFCTLENCKMRFTNCLIGSNGVANSGGYIPFSLTQTELQFNGSGETSSIYEYTAYAFIVQKGSNLVVDQGTLTIEPTSGGQGGIWCYRSSQALLYSMTSLGITATASSAIYVADTSKLSALAGTVTLTNCASGLRVEDSSKADMDCVFNVNNCTPISIRADHCSTIRLITASGYVRTGGAAESPAIGSGASPTFGNNASFIHQSP